MSLWRIFVLVYLANVLGYAPEVRGAAVQQNFACEDFITQTAAQTYLDQYPADPYGLDPDGDGIACEDMQATGDPTSNASEETLAETSRQPLDARLGGTVESWEAEFGPPLEPDPDAPISFTEYDVPGYSTVHADEHLGRIESISLFAPRPAGEEWIDAEHDMNWSLQEAHAVAQGFLPRDARLDETLVEDPFGFVQTMCTSVALTAEVASEIYDYVDDTPQYGRCRYVLWYPDFVPGDEISRIVVQLQIEEPPDEETSVEEDVSLPQPAVDTAQVGLDSAELAYIDEMEQIMSTVGDCLIQAGQLFQNPRPLDENWVFEVALHFVIWQTSYQEALALDPPPAFEEIHGLYVDALRLTSEAADDIIAGMDTDDLSRLSQAEQKLGQANDLINLATALVEEFAAERGG